MTLRLLPCGDAAVMLDLDSLDEVLRLQPVLDATRPTGVVDIVPGARSILVTVDPDVLPLAAARAWALAARPADEAGARGGDPVEIEVVYDGEDLADVAALLGIGVREVVERHTSGTWTVAFGGFAPGFGYLAGVPGLEVPRRSSPRPRVPAGAVALAGEFSGIYPRVSPGGWQLIGTTRAVLWDPEREPAALLQPGSAVRFREVTA
ncbi:5-oxoprolinase subunit B family protein [Clavibacter sp. Sh2141]|uniref:5-oxoprolinase subunit B family protein n=1 Tax=Clavibacter sp. Sh2141 TaxID=3395374 RepID=UPI0039BD57AE